MSLKPLEPSVNGREQPRATQLYVVRPRKVMQSVVHDQDDRFDVIPDGPPHAEVPPVHSKPRLQSCARCDQGATVGVDVEDGGRKDSERFNQPTLVDCHFG